MYQCQVTFTKPIWTIGFLVTFLAALRHDLEWAAGLFSFMRTIGDHLQAYDYQLIMQLHGLSLISKLVRPHLVYSSQKDALGNLPPS